MQYDDEGSEPPLGFEWDPSKEATNREKHGIRFRRASLVFFDPHRIEEESSRREHREFRRKAIGSVHGQVIVVIYTFRGDRRRMISARRASPHERSQYNQSQGIS